ncbi:MAG: radical SAM protein [Desulfuromonadales bacterium]
MTAFEASFNKGLVSLPYPPLRLRIEPTNVCNLKCVSCPNTVEKPQHQGFMDMVLYKKIVDQVKEYPRPTTVILYLGGEPLLHKEFIEMIDYASKFDLFVQFNTNGALLTTDMISKLLDTDLNRIAFSFDDMSPGEYEVFRKNSSYNKTLNNILEFLRTKQERQQSYPQVEITSLKVLKPGDEITKPVVSDDFVSLFKGYPVETTVNYIHSWAGGFEVHDGHLTKSAENTSDYNSNSKKTPKCFLPWYDMVVNYRGEVITCCLDLQYKNVLGDTKEEDLIDIWNSKKFQELRRTILRNKNDKNLLLCSTCSSPALMPPIDLRSITFYSTGNIHSCQGRDYKIVEFVYKFIPSDTLKKIFCEHPKGSMFILRELQKNGTVIIGSTELISGARVVVGDYYLYLNQHEEPFSKEYLNQSVYALHKLLLELGYYFTRKNDVIEYYKNPDEANKPFNYLGKIHLSSSEYLYSLIQQHCPGIHSILDAGCNSGRNMAYLKERMNVTIDGMEINDEAIDLLYDTYPSLAKSKVYPGDMVDSVARMKERSYDLIFSMASLQGIHPEVSNKFWEKLARVSSKYIITIELESLGGANDRTFLRNYKHIFVSAKYREIYSEHINDINLSLNNYQARIFKRIS